VKVSKKERASSKYTAKKDLSFCRKKFLSSKANERDVKLFPSAQRGFFVAPPVPFLEGLINNPE